MKRYQSAVWRKNQVIFRRNNEQALKGLQTLKKTAESEGRASLIPNADMPLHFYCECSDEKCRQRIVLQPSKYRDLHQNSSQFVLIPGHELSKIERVVIRDDDYVIVEKYNRPPPAGDKLNQTDLNHS